MQVDVRQTSKRREVPVESWPVAEQQVTSSIHGLPADPLCGELRGVHIMATGSCVPESVVENSDLGEIGCDPEWIEKRTGILRRRHAQPEERTSDLAYGAAQRCLNTAAVSPDDVDFIIVATTTPDHLAPSTASLVQSRLGGRAAAMDVNAACSGFVYALITGAHFVNQSVDRRVLVVGAETVSRHVDPRDRKTYPLFGDGAGAVLLGSDSAGQKASVSGKMFYQLGASGALGHLITMPLSDDPVAQQAYVRLDGRAVFKWAVSEIPRIVCELLVSAELMLGDIDLFIFHQANRRIIEAIATQLEIAPAKVFVNVDRYGNTAAASVPIALNEAIRDRALRPGSRVMLCGFGAGLSWGSCIVQIGEETFG